MLVSLLILTYQTYIHVILLFDPLVALLNSKSVRKKTIIFSYILDKYIFKSCLIYLSYSTRMIPCTIWTQNSMNIKIMPL